MAKRTGKPTGRGRASAKKSTPRARATPAASASTNPPTAAPPVAPQHIEQGPKTDSAEPTGAYSRPLTAQQQAFVDALLLDPFNHAAAARSVGVSERRAHVTAAEWLAKPTIRAALDTALAERSTRTKVDADRVVVELERLAFSDLGDIWQDAPDGTMMLKPMTQWPEAARRAISSIKTKHYTPERDLPYTITEITFINKVEPLKLLGTHLGLKFVNRVELTGRNGKPLKTGVPAIFVIGGQEVQF